MSEPIIDREFAEKFLKAADRPMQYHVYQLFHEWWAEAPQSAIDEYAAELASIPGSKEFVAARHLPEPLSLERLEKCAPGTLGDAYRKFIVDNDLLVDLARDYRKFNAELSAAGTLDRMPADLSYMIVRGFQIHDFLHVLTGFDSSVVGELAQAGFHFGQLRFPYHAMRIAVVTAHMAYVTPKIAVQAMDAIVEGWTLGRTWQNLHFVHWEEEIDTPLDGLREKWGLIHPPKAA